jgi:hypothetical protein
MGPLLALLALQSAAIDPSADPALAKPVTVHLTLVSLRDAVGVLAKQTGQSLGVVGTVAELKATILVKGLPAGRTMEALADTMGLVWQKEGTYYRLSPDAGELSATTAYLQAEEKLAELGPNEGTNLVESNGQSNPVRTPGRRFPNGVRRNVAPPNNGGTPSGAGSRFDPYLLAIEAPNGQPPSRLGFREPVGDSAFAKAVRAWPSVPTQVDPLWTQPSPSGLPPKSSWENGTFTLSDLLASWHDATGLPVVADAFRISMRTRMIPAGTGLASLQALAAAEGLGLKLSDGVVRLRHPAFWRLRRQEIPETTWRALEHGVPSLDNFAAFASGLTAPQAAAFRSEEAPLSHIKTAAIREAYPALLLWNALPDAARAALYAGSPVALSAVSNATNAYAFALREAPYYNAGNPSQALATNPNLLGIFGRSTPKSMELRLSTRRAQGITYQISLP